MFLFAVTFIVAMMSSLLAAQSVKRVMTFMDIIEMRGVGGPPAISPDTRWMLYTITTPDWKTGKSQTDIWLASTDGTINRQMTFTREKNETNPRWSRDGKYFVFTSDRDAASGPPAPGDFAAGPQNQLFRMRPDGGEAEKITDAKEGVGAFSFSKDVQWLAFSAGKPEEQQIWIFSTSDIGLVNAKPLTKHATPILSWQFSPDSKTIYFLSPDTVDKADKERVEKKFTVKIRDQQTPPNHLWAFDLESKQEKRLTSGNEYTVTEFTLSKDSKWIGFHGRSMNRYEKGTEASDYADLYLLEVATGKIERLTDNKDIVESPLSFSPDSSMIAFAAADDFKYFHNKRIYVRPVTGGTWKKLGGGFDADLSVGFWSKDGKTIYFNEGMGATSQFFSVSVDADKVMQLTQVKGALNVFQDDDTGFILTSYSDPTSPANYYAALLTTMADRASWKQLTDSNPQAENFILGETEAIRWKSSDGTMVEGVLVKPIGYEKGKRYPLIVQIHGGPAGADLLSFNGRYVNYSHVYAANGYFCLMPNYRGSTNYGEKFKLQISGDYFRQAYEDIMTGVDNLIKLGMVDGNKMGVMGWSAGGHWSNWILTHTNRFKAISSGAGAMNWTSMYAQTDIQRNREFYFKGLPYDRFEHYWEVSPLKYIKNAKTPTLIHVVDGDPRVPRSQSEELHMALKKLGVPTEFQVYPGSTHGIPDMRNQMVKMVSEFGWFEKWINGKEPWLDWKTLNDTVKDESKKSEKSGEEKEAAVKLN